MKIIVTEAQFNELNSHSERYLNQLLDKISNDGINSLSDSEKEDMNKMSQDVDVSIDEPKDKSKFIEDINSIRLSFIDLFPTRFKINIDEQAWLCRIESMPDDGDFEMRYLVISNPATHLEFAIIPFAEYEPVFRIITKDNVFNAPMAGKIPKNEAEIKMFYEHFIKHSLSNIIKLVTSKDK